ncbi:MAG: hypothetical protein ABSH13_19115 [Candidatus Acidiferrum sp.]|jgi:hypothetical protein
MATPHLPSEQVSRISELVAEYISDQRRRFVRLAANLPSTHKERLTGFFRQDLLETTRTVVLEKERIDNPSFYSILKPLGFSNLPDFALMAAVTYQDVVVSHEPFSDGLLFHELVHVEQYRQLGVPSFSALYVRGFLRGGGYDGIALEINAYDLGGRFEADPRKTFSVGKEVSTWIAQDRF